jgi:hypothetical protein
VDPSAVPLPAAAALARLAERLGPPSLASGIPSWTVLCADGPGSHGVLLITAEVNHDKALLDLTLHDYCVEGTSASVTFAIRTGTRLEQVIRIIEGLTTSAPPHPPHRPRPATPPIKPSTTPRP